MLRSSVSRARLHGSSVFPLCPVSSSPACSVSVSRSLHSSTLLTEKRQVDGSWVSDNTRIRERQSHFDPPTHKPKERETKPVFPEKRPHDRVSPQVNPASGTHTLLKQRKDIRMQFQLEPVTRTLVKGDAAAGNAKINDYSHAEVFTRAPWPAYREIILNRAAHLHTLNPAMIQQLNHLTQNVELNRDISATLLTSHHISTANRPKSYNPGVDKQTGLKRIPYEKTFSGGMDMHTLAAFAQEQAKNSSGSNIAQSALSKYFRSLYSFAFNMNKLRSPLVVVMDGLAVGAGAGFALHSRYRVATENTRISFPQASLGWFPDAGASYILPRLDGKIGLFLALTGWQVRAFDATRLGFCTHFCESDELHRFGRRIGDSSLTYQFAEDTIEQSFGMFNENGKSSLPMPIHDLHEVITPLFTADSVDAILVNMLSRISELKAKGARATQKDLATCAFIEEMQRRMMASSPTGLKVTFELLRLSEFLPLEKCLQLEFRLSQNLLSLLPNPTKAEIFSAPNFNAKSLAQVTPQMMEALFEENPDEDKELNLAYPEKTQQTFYI